MSAVIEINGLQYDAFTGQLIDGGKHRPPKNIDGILPAKEAPAYLAQASRLVSKPQAQIDRPTLQDVIRPKPAMLHRHAPEAASTLVRYAVSKPVATIIAPPLNIKISVQGINAGRWERAKAVTKSPAVQRFPLQMSDFPTYSTVSPALPASFSGARPAAAQAQPQKLESLLEQALRQATAHQETPTPKRRVSKRATVVISLTAFLLLAGTLVTSNLSSIGLDVASAKAGFSASLPSYHPAGYHLQGIAYSAGTVTSTYASNSDQRHYTLTEKPSEWSDAALLQDFVQKNADSYQTMQTNGRTIYLYGNQQATWVWQGVWFVLQSQGALGDRQLVDMASSL